MGVYKISAIISIKEDITVRLHADSEEDAIEKFNQDPGFYYDFTEFADSGNVNTHIKDVSEVKDKRSKLKLTWV